MSTFKKFLILYPTENQQIAEQLSMSLQQVGHEAMILERTESSMSEQIGQVNTPSGTTIVLLVTDNFLKSYGCMNGILQAAHKWGDTGQLLTITADGVQSDENGNPEPVSTNFERVGDIIQYMNFWQDKFLSLRKAKRGNEQDEELEELIAITKEISADVGEFLRYVRGLGYDTIEAFYEKNELQIPSDDNQEDLIEGAAILQSDAVKSKAKFTQSNERSLVEMIKDSSEELMAENADLEQLGDALGKHPTEEGAAGDAGHQQKEQWETDDEMTQEVLDSIPGLDLLDEPDLPHGASDQSLLEGLLNDKPNEADSPPYDPFEEPPEKGVSDFSEKELEEIDQENEELMSILDDVLLDEGLTNASEGTEFKFVGEDPDNPGDFNIDSILENDDQESEVHEMAPLEEEIDIPVGEEEVLLNLVATEGDAISSEEILEQAIDYFSENKMQEGITYLSEAVANQPTGTTLLYYQAYALARYANDYDGAKTALETLLQQDSEHPDAWFLLAELAENQQDFEGARKCFNKVIENQADFPEAHYRLGILIADHFAGEEEAAAASLRVAVQQDEQNVDAIYMLATLLNEHLDQPENSVKHFRKVILHQPEHPFANYDLALVYHGLGDGTRALEFYKKAVLVNPELKTPQNDLAFEISVLEHQFEEETVASDQMSVATQERASKTHLQAGHEINDNDGVPSADPQIDEDPPFEIDEAPPLNGNGPHTDTAEQGTNKPRIETKVVLITGGTAGIGKATAEVFAQHGYQVLITGRRRERLTEIAKDLTEKYEVPVMTLSFDVRDPAAVKAAFDHLPDDWKHVDILINNAGLSRGLAPIQKGELDDWEAMIDTNVKGLLYVTRAISPHMVERKKGHIINVSSIAGTEVYPGGNVYCASKAAVSSLTRSMRLDLHQHNIRVSQVAPGHVEETEFARVRFDGDEEKAAQVYENFQPLKSSDVAETIFFIASRPPHVNIQDIYLFGTQQASATMIDRSGKGGV